MMGTKILVIDDDVNICETLRVYFEHEGYEVKTANDGAQGVEFFKMYEPDIVLLDIMLPKKDGWAVCREIREVSSKPIIMITAKGEVFDKVLGLEMGADDFVVKPFDLKELAVRIKAVLRRCNSHENPSNEEVIKFENIEISLQKYELKLKGKSVDRLSRRQPYRRRTREASAREARRRVRQMDPQDRLGRRLQIRDTSVIPAGA